MGESQNKKKRKERIDKKQAINPTITLNLYDLLSRLSYVCDRPLKDIGETLCSFGLRSENVIRTLQPKFRRDYWFDENNMMGGNPDLPVTKEIIGPDQHRINLRLRKHIYEDISKLAYTLNAPKTRAAAMLIETSLLDMQVLGDLLEYFIREELDPKRMKHLNVVLRYVNRSSHEDNFSLSVLLAYLFDRLGDKVKRLTEIVDEFIEEMTIK